MTIRVVIIVIGYATAAFALTPSPSPSPWPTWPAASQIDRRQVQFPVLVNGTPIPDSEAVGIDMDCDPASTSEWVSIGGKTVRPFHCQQAVVSPAATATVATPTPICPSGSVQCFAATPVPTLTAIPCDPCSGVSTNTPGQTQTPTATPSPNSFWNAMSVSEAMGGRGY